MPYCVVLLVCLVLSSCGDDGGGFTFLPTVTSIDPMHGPIRGGALVTITGTNFVAGLTVRLDGDPGTVMSVTPTEVQFLTADVTPSGTGNGHGMRNLYVTNPATPPAELTDAFWYDDVPTITDVPVNHGTNAGPMIQVLGTAFQPGFTAKFGAVDCPFVTWISSTEISLRAPDQSPGTTCFIIITNPDGEQATTADTLPAPIIFSFD
jgi:hypothetical protein